MTSDRPFLRRFEDLKRYIDWHSEDDQCSAELVARLTPHFEAIVTDFYDEIRRHATAFRVITGGQRQIARLKNSLTVWLHDALEAQYDADFLEKRRRIGRRHVEIGLDQIYVNAAFARIRGRLHEILTAQEDLSEDRRNVLKQSLDKRLDLDLAIMADAYHIEYQVRQVPVDHARLKQQKLLAVLSGDALAGAALETLYDQAVAYLMETFAGDFAEYLEYRPADQTFCLRSAAGWPLPEEDEPVDRCSQDAYFRFITSMRDCVGIEDHDLNTELSPPIRYREHRIVSSLQVAVRSEDDVYGILAVHFQKRRQFRASDYDFMVSMANLIANAVHRKGIESQRQQSEHQVRRLIDRLPAGAVYVAGHHLQVNQAVEVMTGHDREQLATIDDWNRLLVESSDYSSAQPDASAEGTIHQSEVRIVRPDGEQRIIAQLKFKSAVDEIWLLYDITEQEEQRRKQLQAERLAAIGQMITGLAHESRNALQRIQACTEMLELEFQPESAEMKLIGRLQQAQDDLQQLFDEVRNYAAPIILETRPTDLVQVCRQAWEQTMPLRRGRDTDLQLQWEQEVLIQADQFRLVQVFRNLFENALAACADPAIIRAEVSLADESLVRITVSDNGPGFDETIAKRMLEPFFTTKTKGSGLGMAIASRIVESHGGQIVPISQPGRGGKFLLSFPVAADAR
ncbi:GAF domain-containing protein [Bremerella cremea]|uniref:histidine kinase n=1 Tax=Bremerella cremea TaxID=1031537 RepID=A0A368KQA4_9BACT|nr:protoglobin domain-containing protein [Bremerella cremea]RCS48262.1 GAF domain-containing protein [Bremerella cremea]